MILGIILVFPILVFVFLQSFGENHYALEVYHTTWIEEVDLDGEPFLDTVRDQSQLEGRKIVDTLYHQIPEFKLTNQDNQAFYSKQLEGKIYVADFFFTRCGNPSLCPRMSSELRRVQEVYRNDEEVKIVSFTVDPQYDQPAVLKAYGESYEADFQQWSFLTGAKKEIYDLAYEGFKINAMEETDQIRPDFLHATKFMLIDKEGRIRGYYDGIEREEVDKLILEIKILKHEYTL